MRFRASLAFGLAAIALLVPTSGVPQRSHAPRGRVVLTLGVPGQPIRLGDKPLLDVRIENVGTTRISFFGEFWYDENLRCSLTRDGVPQKRSPRMAANRIRPNMSNLVTLVPGAYFGRYVRFGDDMFGFALEKTSRQLRTRHRRADARRRLAASAIGMLNEADRRRCGLWGGSRTGAGHGATREPGRSG